MIASIIVTAIGMCFFDGESVIGDLVRQEPVYVYGCAKAGDEDVDLTDRDEENFADGRDGCYRMVAMNGGAE